MIMHGSLTIPETSRLPSLPEKISSLSGVIFDPREDIWSYRESSVTVSLNFNKFHLVSRAFLHASKLVFCWYAENMSPSHLLNMHQRLEHFLRMTVQHHSITLEEITNREIINYRGTLSKRNRWYLGALSGFLQKWCELGYPGVTSDAVTLLKQLRIQGNRKGEAVLTMDPEHGPFTDIEVQSIQQALDAAFTKGQIRQEYYLLVNLFMLLGQRSIQYARLKVCDVTVTNPGTDNALYTLRIPRAKQRSKKSRSEFKYRLIIQKIGRLLHDHALQISNDFSEHFQDPGEAPLFPAKQQRSNYPSGFLFHRTADSIARSMELVVNKLNVFSERTGNPLHINATRFRRTIGTRAGAEGYGELVVAELLDHSDTQNVGMYVEAVPEMLDRIDRAVAMQLAPMAQAFAGILILDESESSRKGDPASRVCDPRFDETMSPMGSCGKHGFCGSMAPIACYTCSSFQPWLNGPHEAVLSYLISERERLLANNDLRIASINDRTVLAVAEVVMQCEKMRKESSAV